MDLTEASMAPLQLHVWRAFIAFRFRFFKNDDAMYMMYMMYTNLMLSCDMNCHIPYINIYITYVVYRFMPYIYKNASCIFISGRSPHPSVPGWEKTSCKAADAGATLFGSNLVILVEVYGYYFWMFASRNRGKSKRLDSKNFSSCNSASRSIIQGTFVCRIWRSMACANALNLESPKFPVPVVLLTGP